MKSLDKIALEIKSAAVILQPVTNNFMFSIPMHAACTSLLSDLFTIASTDPQRNFTKELLRNNLIRIAARCMRAVEWMDEA